MTNESTLQADQATPVLKALVIGAGFGGLCMGIKLKEAGYQDFLILEKAADLGGTWRENTYPGAECDIPSALYSYSFEHNADWEFKWSGQAQILKYQHDTAAKHGLAENIRYHQHVVSAVFDESRSVWKVSTQTGEVYWAQHLVTAVGQLHHPSTPEFVNSDEFEGDRFHSAAWDHRVDLTGKRIAVIGNAASAVQFIPEVAKVAAEVSVYQRSPNWMLPKIDRPYAKWEQRLSARVPWITRLYRWYIWAAGEYGMLSAIKGNRLARWAIRRMCLRNLERAIDDPELRAKLIPDYPIGAKRVLFSDHYYPALARDNVHLRTTGVKAFTKKGILAKDKSEQIVDVVIYGTGFKTNPFLADIEVLGRDGRSIREAWQEGAQAYLGVSTHGFPNLHMLYGPNTNLGHTSIIIMHEAQVNHALSVLRHLDANGLKCCEVRAEVERDYNNEIQARLSAMAFSKVAQSWYMDGNKVTNNWAGGTREYQRRLKRVDWSAYSVQ